MKLPLWFLIAIIITLSTLCPTACTPSPERRSLETAEAVIEHDLDSALAILNSIDTAAITSDGDRALHAMLLTMAMDKCHLNPTDDSLIAPAIDYFARKRERRREMLATYYGGRVLYLRGDKSDAIVRFFKAREIAIELGEHFWHGMAARGIADIFCISFNSGDDLRYSLEEVEYIRKSGRQPYLNYAMLDLAHAYYNSLSYENCSRLAYQLLDSAQVHSDNNLKNRALILIAATKNIAKDHKESLRIYTDVINSGHAIRNDSILYSIALCEAGFQEQALLISKQIPDNNSAYFNSRYEILKKTGNYKESLSALEKLHKFETSRYKSFTVRDFTSVLLTTLETEKRNASYSARISRLHLWITIILTTTAIVIMILFIKNVMDKRRREIEEKVLFAQQLQEQIGSLENFRDQLQKNLNRASSESSLTRAELEEKNIIIKKLISSKYDLIKELGQITYENSDSKQMKRRIADKVTSIIGGFSIDDTTIASLENELDVTYNNLMSDLRQQCPSLKEEDFRLYIFSVLGFSAPVISLFLKEEKLQAVYNRKRRLKAKLKELPPEQYERFINHLD